MPDSSPLTTVRQVFNISPPHKPEVPVQTRIRLPRPGQSFDGYSFPVSGLVRLRHPTDRLVSIEIRSDDYEVDKFLTQRLMPRRPRTMTSESAAPVQSFVTPGLRGAGVHKFQGLVNVFGLSPHCRLFVDALLENGTRHRICRFDVDCLRPLPPPSDISPLLVSALPRSGTTWLVDLLAGHPHVVTDPVYPYEVRPATYWAHMLRVLTQPYNDSGDRSELFVIDARAIGGSPFFSPALAHLIPWHTTEYPEELLHTVRRLTASFYGRLLQEHRKRTPAYFIEKFPGITPPLTLRWLYPQVREIMLIRHPHAVMQSIFRFNEKRGYKDFGEEIHGRTEALFASVSRQLQDYLYSFNTRCGDGSGIVVRYEDLAADTAATLASLLELCGLDGGPKVVASMIARSRQRRVREHITSESGQEMKSTLTGQEREWVNRYFASPLATFYPEESTA